MVNPIVFVGVIEPVEIIRTEGASNELAKSKLDVSLLKIISLVSPREKRSCLGSTAYVLS